IERVLNRGGRISEIEEVANRVLDAISQVRPSMNDVAIGRLRVAVGGWVEGRARERLSSSQLHFGSGGVPTGGGPQLLEATNRNLYVLTNWIWPGQVQPRPEQSLFALADRFSKPQNNR